MERKGRGGNGNEEGKGETIRNNFLFRNWELRSVSDRVYYNSSLVSDNFLAKRWNRLSRACT